MKRSHTKEKCQTNQTIIQKCLSVNIGLKCVETNQKSKKEKYTLKTNQGYTADVKKITLCTELHESVREHYRIPNGRPTYLGLYNGKAIEMSWSLNELYQSQKEKKKSLQLYLYYPKSYADLEWRRLTQDSKDTSFSENDNDYTDFDIPDDVLEPIFDEESTNLFPLPETIISPSAADSVPPIHSSTGKDNSLQESFLSADNIDSHVSFTIPSTLISGNSTTKPSLFHSPDSQTARNICDKCNCTYIISCLRCEQDENYQQSLTSDQNSDGDSSNIGLVSKVNDPDVDNGMPVADVRRARLAHFNRNSGLPLRYRHSIGSPSLSCATIDKKTAVESSKEYFGENEVKRFFLSEASIETKNEGEKETEIDIVSFINQAKHDFQVHNKNEQCKHIIIQRDPDRFWHLLLKQTFDLSQENILVRFAGEAAADLGGPLREFLTLAMATFSRIPGIIFGDSNSIGLKLIPEYLIKNQYFKLGQIIGLSILTIGRGPECFNLMLVKSIFNVHFGDVLPAFTDGFLSEKIEKIQNGDKNELYEYEILPSENTERDIRVFILAYVILKNSSAIEQLTRGLGSIHKSFIARESCNLMKTFLMESKNEVSVDQFLGLIEFKRDCEPNSNEWNIIRNLECDFELFVAALANKEIPEKTLSDFLFLLTGYEKVPPFGLHKKIEVSFNQAETFANISTCSFRLTLPVRDIEKTLKLCLEFGGGFGSI